MPTPDKKELLIAVAKEKLTSHLIEQGIARPFAEAHAATAKYESFGDNAEVAIECGGTRAMSHNQAELSALAVAIAKRVPDTERSGKPGTAGDTYDPAAAGRAMAEAQRKQTQDLHSLALR